MSTDTAAPVKLCVVPHPRLLLDALPRYGDRTTLNYRFQWTNKKEGEGFAVLYFEEGRTGIGVHEPSDMPFTATIDLNRLDAYLRSVGDTPLVVYAAGTGYQFAPLTPPIQPTPPPPVLARTPHGVIKRLSVQR